MLNGGLTHMSMAFVSSETVLPAFVQTLTASSVMVGLAGGLMRLGWSWPQVLISRVIEERPRKMPLFLLAGSGRCASWFTIGLLTFWVGDRHPGFLLAGFMCLYALASSLMGIYNVPWMDVIGKVIPSRERSRVFALRRLLGAGLATLVGGVISYILSRRSGLAFPYSYGLLFLLSGAGSGLAILTFGQIREPVEPVRPERLPMGAYLASGLRLIREDADYRRLCGLRFVWGICMMGTPFYVPYAMSGLGIGVAFVGLFVSVMQFSSVLSNLLWAYVGHRKGNRALLVYGSYLLALSILVPLLAEYVPDRSVSPLSAWGIQTAFNFRIAFFAFAFVFSGFATGGLYTGRMAYVLDIAPPDRRPTYTSFMNMFMLPQGVLPLLAGLLVAWTSYRTMFSVALVFVPLSVLLAHRLTDRQK